MGKDEQLKRKEEAIRLAEAIDKFAKNKSDAALILDVSRKSLDRWINPKTSGPSKFTVDQLIEKLHAHSIQNDEKLECLGWVSVKTAKQKRERQFFEDGEDGKPRVEDVSDWGDSVQAIPGKNLQEILKFQPIEFDFADYGNLTAMISKLECFFGGQSKIPIVSNKSTMSNWKNQQDAINKIETNNLSLVTRAYEIASLRTLPDHEDSMFEEYGEYDRRGLQRLLLMHWRASSAGNSGIPKSPTPAREFQEVFHDFREGIDDLRIDYTALEDFMSLVDDKWLNRNIRSFYDASNGQMTHSLARVENVISAHTNIDGELKAVKQAALVGLKNMPELTDELRDKARAMFDYLAPSLGSTRTECADELAHLGKTHTIVAFVPGHSALQRADEAGRLFRAGLVDYVALSGNVPYEALDKKEDGKEKVPTITEAHAMKLILQLRWGLKPKELSGPHSKVLVDERSFTTMQCVRSTYHRLLHLRQQDDSPADLKRKLVILVVTSPYHLRRTMMQWRSITAFSDDLVANVLPWHAPTSISYTRDGWYDLSKTQKVRDIDDEQKRQEVIQTLTSKNDVPALNLMISEYYKLNGGRITCEF